MTTRALQDRRSIDGSVEQTGRRIAGSEMGVTVRGRRGTGAIA